MDVLVNQLGYEAGTRPTVVLRGTRADDPGEVRLERPGADGSVVASADAELSGPVEDWRDWVFWTAALPAVEAPGEYVVAVESGDGVVRSRRFDVGADLLRSEALADLLSYFRVERCTGPYDRADRSAAFTGDRDDAVDVRGGWYDASGDVSKYLSHLDYANYMNPQQIPLVVWSLLGAAEGFDDSERYETAVGDDVVGDGDDPLGASLAEAAREEARFGADFLVRAQDDAGYFYVTVFDGWTGDPDEREICALEGFDGERSADYEAGFRQGGGMAIAALARASRSTAGQDEYRRGKFDAETYLDAAVTGFEHLQEHNEAYLDDGTENLLDDYCALLAASELAAATGEQRFADAATGRAKAIVARQTADGWFAADEAGDRPFVHATDEGLPIVALCRFLALVDGSDEPGTGTDGRSLRETVRDVVVAYWRFELDLTDDVVNPFGYARQYAKGVDDAEPRARFFMPQDNETGYWWLGENARLGSLATAALVTLETFDVEAWDLEMEDIETDDLDGEGSADRSFSEALRTFASDQLDWILGRNPFDTCMFQGVGANPRPFVPSAPQTPGGIVNGVTAGVDDESGIAFLPAEYARDYDHTWRWTEQWLPHAAWFLLAGTRLRDAA